MQLVLTEFGGFGMSPLSSGGGGGQEQVSLRGRWRRAVSERNSSAAAGD